MKERNKGRIAVLLTAVLVHAGSGYPAAVAAAFALGAAVRAVIATWRSRNTMAPCIIIGPLCLSGDERIYPRELAQNFFSFNRSRLSMKCEGNTFG